MVKGELFPAKQKCYKTSSPQILQEASDAASDPILQSFLLVVQIFLPPTSVQQQAWLAWPSGRTPRRRGFTGSPPSSPSSASSSAGPLRSCPSCPSVHRWPASQPPSGPPSHSKLAPSGPSPPR